MKYLSQLLLAISLSIFILSCESGQKELYDEAAINSLDSLTQTIGRLHSVSLTINVQSDKFENGELISKFSQSDVYMRDSNRMYIYTDNELFRKGFWYDGKQLATLLYNENQYDIIDVPNTIIAMIDSTHNHFKLDFPAADFFYPTLTDDLINHFDTIVALGQRQIMKTSYTEINATNANLDVYILIDPNTKLPKQLEIYYLGERKGEKYIATFSNWRTNPHLPESLFMFTPPKDATKETIIVKKQTS
ncbi:DUF2092 domain-containing protein [Reichenbachiella agarivorans]|uniref:DUF2092 domain-containing protein n=1 Tax=Reichenbachiella agarivorans TaxID=2979464 RepID=A0ABY6CMP7_9BACT|nr:DUF2092 domain-containing protein [Reichenbachiella agarivorans]UXP31792.1 DUF2092 domain-containing protein [Reichenbachiella agarivorans]